MQALWKQRSMFLVGFVLLLLPLRSTLEEGSSSILSRALMQKPNSGHEKVGQGTNPLFQDVKRWHHHPTMRSLQGWKKQTTLLGWEMHTFGQHQSSVSSGGQHWNGAFRRCDCRRPQRQVFKVTGDTSTKQLKLWFLNQPLAENEKSCPRNHELTREQQKAYLPQTLKCLRLQSKIIHWLALQTLKPRYLLWLTVSETLDCILVLARVQGTMALGLFHSRVC